MIKTKFNYALGLSVITAVLAASSITLAHAEATKAKAPAATEQKKAADAKAPETKPAETTAAAPTPAAAPAPNPKDSANIERKELAEKQSVIIHEAKDAVAEILQAIVALENKDSKTALAALKSADANLAVVVGKNAGLDLVPIDVDVKVTDFEGDNASLTKLIADADKFLDGGQLQEARKMIMPLASEIELTVTSIPLNVFPNAVKEAIKLSEANDTTKAAGVLADALNTRVKVSEIKPLPILRAEKLLTAAAELEHTLDLSKDQNRQDVLKFVDAAKEQLKTAELLGYGGKDSYQTLYTAIDEMKTVIATEKAAATWDKIKGLFSELKNKLMPAKK